MIMEYNSIIDIKRLQFITKVLRERLPEGAQVLDVGCGNGIISRSLGKEGFHVKGIDVSDKAIAKARQLNTSPNVSFDVISAEKLVAGGERYHAVICSEVLEHLNKPEYLVKVLYEVLHPNAFLIVTVPNGKGPRETFVTKPVIALQKKNNWLWRFVKKMKAAMGYSGSTVQSDADDLTHVQFFTRRSLKELAEKNNFEIVSFGKTNFIEDVFPFSFITKRFKLLQKLDCAVAEILPYQFTGGFVTVWEKTK